MVKPKDQFWPLARYRKFGDPNAPRNKKLNHRIVIMGGYRGVLVRGDDGEGPWEVVTKVGNRVELDNELDADEGDAEAASAAFVGIRKAMRKNIAEAAAGAVQSVLQKAAMTGGKRKRKRSVQNAGGKGKGRKRKKRQHQCAEASFSLPLVVRTSQTRMMMRHPSR